MRLFTVAVVVGLILGCAGAKKDGGGSLLGDDSIEQDAACADYLDCLAAVDPSTLASVQATYGTDGTCWADEATAGTCVTACGTGLSQMHDDFPEEAACDDGSPLNAGDLEGDWTFETVGSDGGCSEYDLAITTTELQVTADGNDAFTADGHVVIELNSGGGSSFDVSFDCALAGEAFDCPEADGDLDSYWAFSGQASASAINGTLSASFGDGSGSRLCTENAELEGTRR
jgi:hypothetical protein